ncbi:MAG: L-seryl-tRNA(Sec) selenium transferase [Candidatus Cloacimonadia bacterium]
MKNKRRFIIPAMNKIIDSEEFAELKEKFNPIHLKRVINRLLEEYRLNAEEGGSTLDENELIKSLAKKVEDLFKPSLKPVINGVGVILHTNLGRAPFGEYVFNTMKPLLEGYCNLEFDLEKGMRGSRNTHLSELLRFVLNCEESLLVNNNAAALFLILKGLAEGSEVIVSRGELVEIGGSFRIPDIIQTSGAKIVEVGTTNKTKLSDYEKAITENTAMILKVHKSNYYIHGFTEEVELKELSTLAKKHNLHLVFDLGTGLLDNTLYQGLESEPDVKTGLSDGADLVCFSCDKILGGPQGGIVVGKKRLVDALAKHPLMRVLRVDKLTISALHSVLSSMIYKPELLSEQNLFLKYANRSIDELESLAKLLKERLSSPHLKLSIIDNKALYGGGTLPQHTLDSKAVLIEPLKCSASVKKTFAETLHQRLLDEDLPILAILKEGCISIDVLVLNEKEIDQIAQTIHRIIPFWE